MPESPNPGQSYEAWISSKAGASPPTCPTCNGSGLVGELQDCGDCNGSGACPDWLVTVEFIDKPRDPNVPVMRDWPGGMPKPPPYPADDEAQ